MAISADTSDPIDDSKGGLFSWGKFQQDKETTLLVYVDLPEGTRGRQVQVTFLSRSLKIVALGKEIKSGALYGPIVVDESTWEIADGKLLPTLQKEAGGWWDRVWEADAPVDAPLQAAMARTLVALHTRHPVGVRASSVDER